LPDVTIGSLRRSDLLVHPAISAGKGCSGQACTGLHDKNMYSIGVENLVSSPQLGGGRKSSVRTASRGAHSQNL